MIEVPLAANEFPEFDLQEYAAPGQEMGLTQNGRSQNVEAKSALCGVTELCGSFEDK